MKPPLVSVVISNYNYEKYIAEAMQSVKDQQYPHVECIIVDDCSTDESLAVISLFCAKWPDVKLVQHQSNLGQSASILSGLALANGQFIVFLDADDILMPNFVDVHLAVHMSAAKSIGFTCCDSLQVFDGHLVRGRNSSIAKQFFRETDMSVASRSSLERLAESGILLPWVPPSALRYVHPHDLDWAWSTTSCMCFRKDAADLICGAAELSSMRIGTDNYLAIATNLWTGSIVIDRQLVNYRIHDKNGFARRVHLDGFAGHDPKQSHAAQTAKILFSDMQARFKYFADLVESKERFIEIVASIRRWLANSIPGDIEAEQYSIVDLVTRNRKSWESIVGRRICDGMLVAASTDDHDAYIFPAMQSQPANAVLLSQESIRKIATEVWFEKQRWGLAYKIAQRISHFRAR